MLDRFVPYAVTVDGRPHRVVVLALADAVVLDLAIPMQLFSERPALPYRATLAAARAGDVCTTGGFTVRATAGLAALRRADTVVVPGFSPPERSIPDDVSAALRAAARRCRVVSICTGAFALAAAGLLDGRRATTHWQHAADLARRYPAIDVVPDVLYVDEGNIMTSAGVAAGIDLCLHIIRKDLGADAANRVARQVVVAPHRDGGQAQYIERSVATRAGDGLAPTMSWALQRLDEPLTVAELARHACLSPRTLARRFETETGTSPLRWLTHQRIAAAQSLLETTDDGLDRIAEAVGFGTATNLRLHFRRRLGTTPTAYRRSFSARRPAPVPPG